MFNYGNIVLQEKTMINGVNTKDNKKNRLSVVLFNFYINDQEYVCTCPITNHKINLNKVEKNFLYIPYAILDDTKLCSIKIDSAFIYPGNEINNTGLKLNKPTLLKLYNKIIELDDIKFNKEHYEFIKSNVHVLKEELDNEEKRRIKDEKKLRKQLRKEKKKEYKNIKNN